MVKVSNIALKPEELIIIVHNFDRALDECTDEERDKIKKTRDKLADYLNKLNEQPRIKNLAVYTLFGVLLLGVAKDLDVTLMKKHLGEQNGT